jgi:predicted DNA-binding protein (UPF0251 family)
MARPKKLKQTSKNIECNGFVPLVPVCLEQIFLDLEELEALKLKDFQGLEQKQAAQKMAISQPTFHRLITSARKKIADALVNAKEIKIRNV